MSYNGSGTFQINSTGQPVVSGTVISSTAFNALTADLATGLSTAITKDGQTATTARIPFAAGINSTLVTDSSSTTTGSIITAGGAGIAKALFVGTTANVAGAVTLQSTLAVGGVATYSAQPIFSSLTASSAVATDASKGLVSVTNTGTGNNVLATSPTLVTPVLGAASATSVTVAAGAVGTPSITTTGDTNTGIFFPAADTIAFSEGGAEAMRIDSSGQLGIGVTPAFKLDISGSGTTAKVNTLDTHDGGASLSTWMKVGRRAGTGTNAYINTLHSGSDAVSALTFAFGTTGTGTEVARIDSSGNVLVTNAAGLGYGTGAGGTVTQATNKGTAVTLNKPTGQVTTNNAALGAGATVSFSINNSIITATDNIMVVVTGGSSYTVQPAFVSGGVANIRLTNITGGSLSEAVVINFAVIKGATS